MAEVFLKEDITSLLKNKKVLLLGDSNVRALYKDLIWLYKHNTLIDGNCLKRRMEDKFLGDKLLSRSKLTRGRDFSEHRLFESENGMEIEFVFITRCYSDRIEDIFKNIKAGKRKAPDVIFMNSCLWDISRWGPNGVRDYKTNMQKLMKLLTHTVPLDTLFIWGTALPIAAKTSGGLIIKQIEFLQASFRVHVMEANLFTASLVSAFGFDVIDFHFFMHFQIIRRSADGIHFLPPGMRFMTNLLLTHIALSWDVPLPRRNKNYPGPMEVILQAAQEGGMPAAKVDKDVKKMTDIAAKLNCTINPQASASAKGNRKAKKKKRNRKVRRPAVRAPSTPPLYEKASRPVSRLHVGQGTSYLPAEFTSSELAHTLLPQIHAACSYVRSVVENFHVDSYDDFGAGSSNSHQNFNQHFSPYDPPRYWDTYYNPRQIRYNNDLQVYEENRNYVDPRMLAGFNGGALYTQGGRAMRSKSGHRHHPYWRHHN